MMVGSLYIPRQARRAGSLACVLFLAFALSACGGGESGQGGSQGGGAAAEPTSAGSRTSCGDSNCEQGEGDNCCTDCGCSDVNKICDRYTVRCIDKAVLSEDARKQVLDKFKPWPLKEEVDEVQGTEAMRVFKFDCGDASKTCIHIVYVDKTGKIVQEQDTK